MNEKALFDNLQAVRTIDRAIKENLLPHAVLFVTPDKLLSKTLLVHFAKKLLGGCDACDECRHCAMVNARSHPDLFFYPKTDGEKIRAADASELLDRVYLKPFMSKNKVILLLGLENAEAVVQNKLLKTLEEPPKNTYFLISANNIANVLPTVRSRAFGVAIEPLSAELIEKIIRDDCKTDAEAITVSQSANGSLFEAYELMSGDTVGVRIETAFKIIEGLTSTKEMFAVSKLFSETKEKEILPVMALVYRDCLCVKNGATEVVVLKNQEKRIIELSKSFSSMALVESMSLVADALNKTKLNINKNTNTDSLMFALLEVKYNCPK